MIKKDRKRLYSTMKEAISARAVITREDTDRGFFEFEAVSSKYGKIAGTFYNAEDSRETPWMPCRLSDWPTKEDGYAVREWHGLRHWKQNYHAFHGPGPEQFVAEAMQHLDSLGVSTSVVLVSGTERRREG
jgi:hypothetical protein